MRLFTNILSFLLLSGATILLWIMTDSYGTYALHITASTVAALTAAGIACKVWTAQRPTRFSVVLAGCEAALTSILAFSGMRFAQPDGRPQFAATWVLLVVLAVSHSVLLHRRHAATTTGHIPQTT